jgi:hypothetical protein
LEWFASDTSHAVEWCTSVGRSMDKLVIIGDSPQKMATKKARRRIA